MLAKESPAAGAGDDMEVLVLLHVAVHWRGEETRNIADGRQLLRGEETITVELVAGTAVFVVGFVLVGCVSAGNGLTEEREHKGRITCV